MPADSPTLTQDKFETQQRSVPLHLSAAATSPEARRSRSIFQRMRTAQPFRSTKRKASPQPVAPVSTLERLPGLSLLRYQAFGISLASVVPLEGLQSDLSAGDSPVDLSITLGGLPSQPENWLTFEVPGAGSFYCDRLGTSIILQAAKGVSAHELSDMLTSAAIPAALWLRGHFVLDAFAAVLPGRSQALVFAGLHEEDQSALVRSLAASGCQILGEQLVSVRVHQHAVQVSGLSGSQPADKAHTLGAIVILDSASTCTTSSLVGLSSRGGLAALLRSRHRPAVLNPLGSEALLLPRFAQLARAVPTHTWSVPHGSTHGALLQMSALDKLIAL